MPKVNVMERPELALANLLRGEPGASIRALLRPASLSPKEQQDLAEQLGLTKGKPNGFKDALMGVITNPLVVLGTILAMRYPVATLANMTKFSDQVVKSAGRFSFLSRLKDFGHIFKDRPDLVKAWNGATRITGDVKEKYMLKAGAIFDEYTATTGMAFGAREDFIVESVMRNLHNGITGNRGMLAPLSRTALLKDYTPGLRRVHDKMTGLFDEFWNEILGTPEARKAMAQIAKEKGLTVGDKVNRYMPTFLDKGAMGQVMEQQWIAHQLSLSEKIVGQQELASVVRRLGGSALKRKGGILPNPQHLRQFPEYLSEKGMAALDEAVAKRATVQIRVGDNLVDLKAVHSMGLAETVSKYVSQMAATHGWTVKGFTPRGMKSPMSHGKIIAREVAWLMNSGGTGPSRANLVTNTYIPLGKGLLTPKQAMAAQQWGARMDWTVAKLHDPAFAKFIPKQQLAWLKKSVANDKGPLSLQSVTGGAAGWLYIGTLGANAGSATLNLMQNFLTTAPLIGPEATLAGMKRVFSKAQKFFHARTRLGSMQKAIAETFPEYVASGTAGHSLADEAVKASFEYSYQAAQAGAKSTLGRGMDKMKQYLMALFSYTEQFNRLTAFEGAMWKGAREGMGGKELMTAARDIVAKTQFMQGIETTPAFLVDKNPLIRQYLQFPSKMLEFVTDTALSTASGVQSGFAGRNYGTIGRAIAATGLVYEAGKGFNMDLSSGLLMGSLPVPRTDSPFGVFPFVPPAVALGGSMVEAAIKGDIKPLQHSLPMLVPGGLAMSRFAGFIPGKQGQRMAQLLGRHYADYDQKTPDGRVAIFSKQGSLVGYESIGEIIMKGSGIPGTGANIRSETEHIQFLLQNRDRIREARNDYLNAMYLNDYDRMEKIRVAFERAYGQPLVIKEAHIKAMQMKRTVPRLERVLQTMPPELRHQFAQVIQTAMFSQGSQFLGIDPSLLGSGSIQSRAGQRLAKPSGFNRQGSYTRQMGPFGNMNASNLGRNQLPDPLASSPLSMGSF